MSGMTLVIVLTLVIMLLGLVTIFFVAKLYINKARSHRTVLPVLEDVLPGLGFTCKARGSGGLWTGQISQCPITVRDKAAVAGNFGYSLFSQRTAAAPADFVIEAAYPGGANGSKAIFRLTGKDGAGRALVIKREHIEQMNTSQRIKDMLADLLQAPVLPAIVVTQTAISLRCYPEQLTTDSLHGVLKNLADLTTGLSR